MSDNILPQPKTPRLIVVAAFDRNEDGELVAAFEPINLNSEDRAKRMADNLAGKHAGVIAWWRDAQPDIGEYGPPTIIAQHGDVPDME